MAHDASGPPAMDWALDHPERVSALVLLNTYYCRMRGRLRPPDAIWLFSTPIVRWFARTASMWFGGLLFRHMYEWQVGRFFRDAEARARFVPLLYEQFAVSPSTHEAFFGLDVAERGDPAAAAIRSPGPRRVRRRRPVPEPPSGTALPRAVAHLGVLLAPRRQSWMRKASLL